MTYYNSKEYKKIKEKHSKEKANILNHKIEGKYENGKSLITIKCLTHGKTHTTTFSDYLRSSFGMRCCSGSSKEITNELIELREKYNILLSKNKKHPQKKYLPKVTSEPWEISKSVNIPNITYTNTFGKEAYKNGTRLELQIPNTISIKKNEKKTINTGHKINIPEGFIGLLSLSKNMTTKTQINLIPEINFICSGNKEIIINIINNSEKEIIINEKQRFIHIYILNTEFNLG